MRAVQNVQMCWWNDVSLVGGFRMAGPRKSLKEVILMTKFE